MTKSLIYLEENLQSSIALRFADKLAGLTNMVLQVIHVEEPDKKLTAGTGWVRRSWEQGLIEAGNEEVRRLLKTENVKSQVLSPIIIVGDRQDEVLNELKRGSYQLYIEGYLNTANVNDFNRLLKSHPFHDAPCSVLVVKNLAPPEKVLILLGEGVETDRIISCFSQLYQNPNKPLEVTVIHYIFKESPRIQFKDKAAAGTYLVEAEKLLEASGFSGIELLVVEGTPEQVSEYIKDYGLVISKFPTRRSPRFELLALVSNPVLLCK